MLDMLQFNAPMPNIRKERKTRRVMLQRHMSYMSLSLPLFHFFVLSVRFPFRAILHSLNQKFPFDFDAAKVQERRWPWGKISPIPTPEIFQGSFVDTAKGSHKTPQVSTVSCCIGEFYPARKGRKRLEAIG